ncbi:hypothetical protein DIPPA_22933 [Diplonema papillatum]|nr:hypothetical protein DIPPA_22933 [Diplonema papillatum]
MLARSRALLCKGVATWDADGARMPVHSRPPAETWKVGMEAEMKALEDYVRVVVVEVNSDGSVFVLPADTKKTHRVTDASVLITPRPLLEKYPPKTVFVSVFNAAIWLGSFVVPVILAINYVLTGEYEQSAPYAVRHAEKDESYDSAFAAGFRKDATPGFAVKQS